MPAPSSAWANQAWLQEGNPLLFPCLCPRERRAGDSLEAEAVQSFPRAVWGGDGGLGKSVGWQSPLCL